MYNLLLRVIYLLLNLPFIGNRNQAIWLLQQKKIFNNIVSNEKPTIWIHCASLGEYEQIKPLIPELKKINPHITITFFSPSGYSQFKDYDLINQIYYLPLDLKENMTRFIKNINPEIVIVAKNEIWPNMLSLLETHNIPSFLIGFKAKDDKINSWIHGLFYYKYLIKFRHIFCQDDDTNKFLKSKKITNTSLIGDTRINQILIDAKDQYNNVRISDFIQKDIKTIIYGSIEKSDYSIIRRTIKSMQNVNHIIVPHEINSTVINELKQFFSCSIYSEIKSVNTYKNNILLIDVFGILKKIYKYSDIAYIGGGFNQGVHNTIEPSVYGNLILFGPKHMNFPETYFLIKHKIAVCVNNESEFQKEIDQALKTTAKSKEDICKLTLPFLNQNQQNLTPIMDIIKTYID
tara:strand:- start:386 stop:1597 length:1212 start_codon:yes stop_codon:yes gene_type:complete